jgi:hypothetical protein
MPAKYDQLWFLTEILPAASGGFFRSFGALESSLFHVFSALHYCFRIAFFSTAGEKSEDIRKTALAEASLLPSGHKKDKLEK